MACAADKGGYSVVAARGIEGEFGDSKAGLVQGIDNDLLSQDLSYVVEKKSLTNSSYTAYFEFRLLS